MVGHSRVVPMLVNLILVLGYCSASAPLEDGQFLRQIVNQYSPPLVISFLHARMNFNQQMIKKIESSLTNLDKAKRAIFDLAQKSLQSLDEQLITLENAGYFDYNGTEKVAYFVEQFIMIDEFYPIEFGSAGMINVELTVDSILEQLKTISLDNLYNQSHTLIGNYLVNVQEKESSVNSNHLQKLSASLAITEFQTMKRNINAIKDKYPKGGDAAKNEVAAVLQKLKIIADFFYSKFSNLADQPISTVMTEANDVFIGLKKLTTK